jgi:hypothetical protein
MRWATDRARRGHWHARRLNFEFATDSPLEGDGFEPLLGGAESAHRKTVLYVVIEIIRIGEAVAVPVVALNQYRTRGHRIDANAVRLELKRPAVPTDYAIRSPFHCPGDRW